MVFVNFPVSDLNRSTAFYEKLGFTKNNEFSSNEAAAMVWDDNFWIMLLNHEFYSRFLKDKTIANTQITSSALITFSLESADAVKKIAETAKANGGDFHKVEMGMSEDQMFLLEVQDPDGNTLEPSWMAM
ncbi:glyoxalase family protein [Carnobacterium sp. 17-4]|nr:glyoxalase family protein [Carnobacterium sp. 17-4]